MSISGAQRSVYAHYEQLVAPLRLVFTQFSQHGGDPAEKPHSFYRLARGWIAMQEHGIVQDYAHIIAVRPDAALTAPLRLAVVCRSHPGLSILSGSFQRPMDFHDRDIDFGVLACSPAALNLWVAPYIVPVFVNSLSCPRSWYKQGDDEHLGCPVARPAAFNGSWTARICTGLKDGGRAGRLCASTDLLSRAHIPFDHLDADGIFLRLLVNRVTTYAWREAKRDAEGHNCTGPA